MKNHSHHSQLHLPCSRPQMLIEWITVYPLDKSLSMQCILICWIMVYLLNSTIHPLQGECIIRTQCTRFAYFYMSRWRVFKSKIIINILFNFKVAIQQDQNNLLICFVRSPVLICSPTLCPLQLWVGPVRWAFTPPPLFFSFSVIEFVFLKNSLACGAVPPCLLAV